jgi:hypothetical protein
MSKSKVDMARPLLMEALLLVDKSIPKRKALIHPIFINEMKDIKTL